MFKFKNLSEPETTEEDIFKADDYKLSFSDFLEKRSSAIRIYVFDLRTAEEYELSHLSGAHSLPLEHFEDSIYQMPYEGDILLYGSGNEEARKAAEILYENGFDTFYFIEDYQELINSLSGVIFTITDSALKVIKEQLETDNSLRGFRIIAKAISTKRARFSHDFVKNDENTDLDTLIQVEGIDVFVGSDSILFLEDTKVDFDSNAEKTLSVFNPEKEVPSLDGSETEKMEQLLEEQINPMVAGHGGIVSLIEIKEGRAYLEFGGGCKGCGMIDVTLKQGVEVIVKENIPGITEILDVTDHADGTNPYYQPGK